ncbi:MAG: hypothetical protein QOE55_3389 [Acidobacteriaceae bacterium]|jgi:DNA-binding transcriptional LysR family regulator|nr:hypothetical protein [Acidobacteriaceae bacterium]
MELRQLHYFVAVAQDLSFRSASRRVHVSQPALSKQVRRLEEELEVRLFRRAHNRISLTEAGQTFRDRAQEMLDASAVAAIEARQTQAGLAGSASIGFVPQSVFVTLPRLLRRFRSKVPKATVKLLEMATSAQILALQEREIDLALVQTTVNVPGLQCEVAATEHLILVLAKAHPLAGVRIAKLDRFMEETVFLPTEKESGLREAILSSFISAGGVPSRVQVVDTAQTAISLSAAGLGIALVPESSQSMRTKGLVYRQLPKPLVPLHTYAVWRKNDTFPLLGALRACL